MPNLELFESNRIVISEQERQLASSHPSKCYDLLRKKGLPIGNAVYFICAENMQTDWQALWNQYEEKGRSVYFNIWIDGVRLKMLETEVMCPYLEFKGFLHNIYEPAEDDICDHISMTKIKNKLKQLILNNQYQFGLE